MKFNFYQEKTGRETDGRIKILKRVCTYTYLMFATNAPVNDSRGEKNNKIKAEDAFLAPAVVLFPSVFLYLHLTLITLIFEDENYIFILNRLSED